MFFQITHIFQNLQNDCQNTRNAVSRLIFHKCEYWFTAQRWNESITRLSWPIRCTKFCDCIIPLITNGVREMFGSPTHRRVRWNKTTKPCKRIVCKAFSFFTANAGFVVREIQMSGASAVGPGKRTKRRLQASVSANRIGTLPPAYSTRRTKQASLTLGPSPAVHLSIRNAFFPKSLKSNVETLMSHEEVLSDSRLHQ